MAIRSDFRLGKGREREREGEREREKRRELEQGDEAKRREWDNVYFCHLLPCHCYKRYTHAISRPLTVSTVAVAKVVVVTAAFVVAAVAVQVAVVVFGEQMCVLVLHHQQRSRHVCVYEAILCVLYCYLAV